MGLRDYNSMVNFSVEEIDDALKNKVWWVKQTAVLSLNITEEQLNIALDDESWCVREVAVRNKNMSINNLNKALLDENEMVKEIAIKRIKEKIESSLNNGLKLPDGIRVKI
jgi:hypothetical protein